MGEILLVATRKCNMRHCNTTQCPVSVTFNITSYIEIEVYMYNVELESKCY